jgi:ribosomal protein L18
VKLFQIEEPEGGPYDASAPGAAIGIDAAAAAAEVAFSIGGNALVLADREGSEMTLPVPELTAATNEWLELLQAARVRAERALARPVSHAVIVLSGSGDGGVEKAVLSAAEEAGIEVLRLLTRAELPDGSALALAAAILAEDLAPRSE